MPRTAVDYSKTVIYKIVCNDLTIPDVYVGSTTDFTRRKNQHKNSCINSTNKCHNFKIYQTIRNNGNWENWSIIQIEEYPCANGNEARARERHWFEQLNSTLNMTFPQRSNKEYYEANKDKKFEYNKKYYELNKDKIMNQHKDYCNSIIMIVKNKRKEVYEKNKDIIREYNKINKDRIKEYKSQPYICECGSECQLTSKIKHLKTKKHINYLNSKITNEINI